MTLHLLNYQVIHFYTNEFYHYLFFFNFLSIGREESINQSFQKEEGESIQKQSDEEKEYYETEKQFHKQVIKKYEEEMFQQKRELILNEEKIAALTQQHEEVTSLLKQTQIKADELQLGD